MGSPCPTNLTSTGSDGAHSSAGVPAVAGTVIEQTPFDTLRLSTNHEFTRRGVATSSWTGYANPIATVIYNEIRNDISTKLGTTTPASNPLGTTVSAGDLIEADGTSPASYNDLVDRLDEWKVACICDCNYCTCDCNYCTCDCNYCTCDCNYCTCDCNYCTCNCNYPCTCNCNYPCTCNCHYCTCNCNYCTCNCNYPCTCNCHYPCTCNCHYPCTCNCNYPCTCNCNAGK